VYVVVVDSCALYARIRGTIIAHKKTNKRDRVQPQVLWLLYYGKLIQHGGTPRYILIKKSPSSPAPISGYAHRCFILG
jgi:hypothetical protein